VLLEVLVSLAIIGVTFAMVLNSFTLSMKAARICDQRTQASVLAHNLHALLASLALPGDLEEARFKRLRFQFINVPARLVQHARQCVVRYFHAGALALIQTMRHALSRLAPG